jgi:hypothetical protein
VVDSVEGTAARNLAGKSPPGRKWRAHSGALRKRRTSCHFLLNLRSARSRPGAMRPWAKGGDAAMEKRRPSDEAHEDDRRGEHRYPDTNQTESEQAARDSRDALKEHLARPGQRPAGPHDPAKPR